MIPKGFILAGFFVLEHTMHFRDLARIAEQAWNEAKPEGDPEWRSTALRHREVCLAAAQAVVKGGPVETEFERAVGRLAADKPAGFQPFEPDALALEPIADKVAPEQPIKEETVEKNYHQTHTEFTEGQQSAAESNVEAPKAKPAAKKAAKKSAKKASK
jgi:hypothetical protein